MSRILEFCDEENVLQKNFITYTKLHLSADFMVYCIYSIGRVTGKEGRMDGGKQRRRERLGEIPGVREKEWEWRVECLVNNSIWLGTVGLRDNTAVCPLCSVLNPGYWDVVAECLGSSPGFAPNSWFLLIFSLESAAWGLKQVHPWHPFRRSGWSVRHLVWKC